MCKDSDIYILAVTATTNAEKEHINDPQGIEVREANSKTECDRKAKDMNKGKDANDIQNQPRNSQQKPDGVDALQHPER